MPLEFLVLIYVTLTLGAIAAIGLYIAHQQRRFGPSPSEDTIFRCRQCGYVYTDDPDVDRSRCPGCGVSNEAIRF